MALMVSHQWRSQPDKLPSQSEIMGSLQRSRFTNAPEKPMGLESLGELEETSVESSDDYFDFGEDEGPISARSEPVPPPKLTMFGKFAKKLGSFTKGLSKQSLGLEEARPLTARGNSDNTSEDTSQSSSSKSSSRGLPPLQLSKAIAIRDMTNADAIKTPLVGDGTTCHAYMTTMKLMELF